MPFTPITPVGISLPSRAERRQREREREGRGTGGMVVQGEEREVRREEEVWGAVY